MFRLFRLIFLVVLIGFLVIAACFWNERTSLAARFLSHKLNVTVLVDDVKLGINTITLSGVSIQTPSLSKVFQSESIKVELPFSQIMQQTLHIERISINNAALNLELYNGSGSANSWGVVLNKLPAKGRRCIIKSLTIDYLQFNAMRSNGRTIALPPIENLEFKNLGEAHPLSLGLTSKIVFQNILSTLTKKPYLGAILDEVVEMHEKLVEGVSSTLPKEEANGIVQESLEIVRRKTYEAKKFLQDLFD